MGRGGKEHKYIQNIVSQYGQDHGWRAVIEQEILDGTGRVDVSLKRDELSIACEISITTTGEQELANVEKSLEEKRDVLTSSKVVEQRSR